MVSTSHANSFLHRVVIVRWPLVSPASQRQEAADRLEYRGHVVNSWIVTQIMNSSSTSVMWFCLPPFFSSLRIRSTLGELHSRTRASFSSSNPISTIIAYYSITKARSKRVDPRKQKTKKETALVVIRTSGADGLEMKN